MQFNNFPWAKLQLDKQSWCVQLGRANGEAQQALLIDALQCGLRPQQQDVWAIACRLKNEDQPLREVVIIGVRQTDNCNVRAGGYKWGLDLLGKQVIICPATHIILRVADNPLELHWKWSENEGERIAVLNFEAATRAEQVTEIWRQAHVIHEHLKPRSGGPKETPKDLRLAAVQDWRNQKGISPKWAIANKWGCTPRTLARWERGFVTDGTLLPDR